MNITKRSKIGFVSFALLLGVLNGWVGCVDEPHHARAYPPPPPRYVESGDYYVYYPGYEVYYSTSRRQYVYRDGRSWVRRPAPPRVSVEVLSASPSVRLDFRDDPSIHHAKVVKQYPKRWQPPKSSPYREEGSDRRDNR
jgi:hypothetical protein